MSNKVALITGGSRGIGAAIAEKMANEGFDIVISYANNLAKANEVIQKIIKIGRNAIAVQADSSTIEGNQKVIAETIKKFGRIDVLVCNAGVASHETIDHISIPDLSYILNLNIRAAMIETHEALKHMTSGGRIILMGSAFAGRVPLPGASVYAATKASLRGFAQGVARDIAQRGVTINVVEPGPIDTEMNSSSAAGADILAKFVATGSYGTVNDISNMVSFLSKAESGYITGAAIAVDGGLLA